MVFFELKSRIKYYYAFSKREMRDLIAVTLVVGFIFSFCDWSSERSCSQGQVDFAIGIYHLIITLIAAAFTIFIHESIHRICALNVGLKSEFRIWWGGLFTSIVLVFASRGIIQVILPGSSVNAIIVRQRLGEFRYGTKYWDNGLIALFGPLGNLAIAFLSKAILIAIPDTYFFQKLLWINVVMAICTMLPLPQLDGINTFMAGRILYVISFFGILGSSILVYFTPIPIAVVGGILITIIATLVYYLKFENPPT